MVNISAVLIWELFEDLRYMSFETEASALKMLRNKGNGGYSEDLRSSWSDVSQKRFRNECFELHTNSVFCKRLLYIRKALTQCTHNVCLVQPHIPKLNKM